MGHMDLTTIAQDALKLLCDDAVFPADDLGRMESLIRDHSHVIGAKMLELYLAAGPLGYEGSSRACPCGANQKFVDHRPRTLATTMGQVTYRRAYYHCGQCGCSCCPFDQAAGVGKEQTSVLLTRAAAALAVHDPFSPSADLLLEVSGRRLSQRSIHRLTRRAGARAAEREKQLALRMAACQTVEALVRPRRLYVTVDGLIVHLDGGWHEVKCVCCYWEDERGKRQSRRMVRLESAEQFAAFVWSLACQCGLDHADEVILLGDGAAWIWDHVASVLGERTIRITDWYHVMEHVWACGNTLFGEGRDESKAWVKKMETLLWEGKSGEVLALLEKEILPRRGAKREAIGSLQTYLKNQGKRVDYRRFREMNLDVGSGRVEATCKQAAVRMKRCGMRWSREGAQSVLSLRSVWLNGQWEQFWAQRPMAA